MELIVLPIGADLDALSSAYGALKLFPNAKLLKPLQLSKSAAAAFKDFKGLFRITKERPKEVERLILVDTCFPSPDRFPYLPSYKELVVFDHHEGCKKLENCRCYIDKVGAATTLLVEEIARKGLPLTEKEATLLALGIYEDTGNFTHLGTTPRDFRAAAFLLEKGASLREINLYVNEKISKEGLEVVYRLLESVEYLETPDGFRVAVATFKGEEYRPDFQELIYQLKDFTERVDGFFIIYEAGNKTYLFGRSNNPAFDTAKILKKLGGGGHGEASSLKTEGISAQRVKKRLVELLKGDLKNIYLENFVSSPPLVVYEKETAKEALQKLVDFGFAGAPVVDRDGKPLGVIFKKDLLRAIKHLGGETEVKVAEIYNPDIKVLSLKDTIWEAENILSKFGQKLIPVVDQEGKVAGVLTRLDIFKNILSETPNKSEKRKIELPSHIEEFAKKVGHLAKELGLKAYIVGGVVRDILLGRPVWDLDIVVEGGSSLELAKRVGEVYGVKVHPFEEFQTAHLKIGPLKVEFATARRESYEKSGAYPKVEPASLKEDIFRRDFTINTLAVALNPEEFGTLIDYVGGLEDLKNGIIRVLHSLSFVEDPIRILRALRFAGRFGFSLSKGTKALLRQAVALGVLRNAPKGRIANELRLALREERFLEILKLYKEFGILEQILPQGFQWSMLKEESLKRLKELLGEFPNIEQPGWVLFANLLMGLKKENALQVLKELSAPSKVREYYLQAKEEGGKILKVLKEASLPSELVKNLKPYRDEAILIVASRSSEEVQKIARFYLKELKPYRVKIEVEKFKKMGLKGKELGRVIEEEKLKVIDRRFAPLLERLREES